MRRLVLSVLLLAIAACAPSQPAIDWALWVDAARSAGHMRTETAPSDAPFGNADLERNFLSIAFDVEEDPFGTGESQALADEDRILRRWDGPIVYAVHAPEGERRRAQPALDRFAARLGLLTGLSFLPQEDDGQRATGAPPVNLHVLIVPEQAGPLLEELRRMANAEGFGGALAAKMLGFVQTWHQARLSPCGAQFFNIEAPSEQAGRILGALVVIRAGLPTALLSSCIEEEMAQSMGLPNDDAEIRPSIFNDEKEFGVLTQHDALLLRILYDDRLSPGMSPDEAMPIVRRIVAGLRPGG